MSLPTPVPGLVIRYAYLWASEARRGRDEGVKDRPCVITHVMADEAGYQTVFVAPITHTPPAPGDRAVEIPAATRRRLGLDEARSWIVTDEINRFLWPGPDIRPAQDAGRPAYGTLPRGLYEAMRRQMLRHVRARRLRSIRRDEK